MQVQITPDCLSLEQFYDIVVDESLVQVDQVTLSKVPQENNEAKKMNFKNRYETAAALQLLLNTPEYTNKEIINNLLAQLNEKKQSEQVENTNESDNAVETLIKKKAIDLFNYVSGNTAQPLIWLTTALFMELTCIQSAAFFQDYVNNYLNSSVKAVSQALKQLTANSKKVNSKGFSPLTNAFLSTQSRLFETLESLRPHLRQLLKSQIETNLNYNFVCAGNLPLELSVQALFSALRLEIVQKNFQAQGKGWKGIPADLVIESESLKSFNDVLSRFWSSESSYDQFLLESQELFKAHFGASRSVPELLSERLSAELTHYLTVLGGFDRLQIGQELIVLLPELREVAGMVQGGENDAKTSENDAEITQSQTKAGKIAQLSLLVKKSLKTSETSRRKPQPARGARDYTPYQLYYREKYLTKFKEIFTSHGLVQIDTPVFELRNILMEKYGEDEKLIYEIQDIGEEQLAMRYDLTVPLARYCVSHGLERLRKFAMGKVYRRDKPYISQGRFREFQQIDVDLLGHEGPINDAEVLWILAECLETFKKPFKYHISHRGVLNAILTHCGVPNEKIKAACSVIDQLDKSSIQEVETKLIEQKGLEPETAKKIIQFIQLTCNAADFTTFLQKIQENQPEFYQKAETSLNELGSIINYLNQCAPHLQHHFCIDLSLARGLDYYTGVIFEARLEIKDKTVSVSGGGRFDGLLGSINPDAAAPVVGGSIGFDRLLALTYEYDDLIADSQTSQDEGKGGKKEKKEKKSAKESQNQDSESLQNHFNPDDPDEQQEGTHTFQQTFNKRKLDVMICAAPDYDSKVGIDLYAELIRAGFAVGSMFRDKGSLKTLRTDMDRGFEARCGALINIGGTEVTGDVWTVILTANRKEYTVPKAEIATWLLDKIGSGNPHLFKKYVQLQVQKLQEGKITAEELSVLIK